MGKINHLHISAHRADKPTYVDKLWSNILKRKTTRWGKESSKRNNLALNKLRAQLNLKRPKLCPRKSLSIGFKDSVIY